MNKPLRTHLTIHCRRFLLALGTLLPGFSAVGQAVSLTTSGSAYIQDFNTLASAGTSSTVPAGWAFAESGTNANTLYTAGTGSSNAGDTYSFGAAGSTERAFGGLQSGSLIPSLGGQFQNNTGTPITTLTVSYTGEQWRLGTANRTDRLDFQYSTDATSLTTGTWTDVDALDFLTPNTTATTGALDGNTTVNRTSLTYTLTGLSIAPGATFWIRFNDFNASGADDGLAVDDFSITPNGVGSNLPILSVNDVQQVEGNSGTTTFTFTVSLSAPAGPGGVTFDIATADNTATVANADYVARILTGQTIPAGSSTYSFAVTVNGDTAPEANETFFVNITNASGATIADGQGVGTIQNDDLYPNGLTPIAVARTLTNQTTVKVAGRVTASNQFGANSPYIQDVTGGISLFGNAVNYGNQVQLGDSVVVSGTKSVFNNRPQISSITGFTVVSGTDRRVPEPKLITLNQLTANEGLLVRVVDVTIGGAATFSATTFPLTAGGQTGTLFIDADTELNGASKPTGPTSITGISDRFNTINELQPRLLTDVLGAIPPTAPTDQFCGGSPTATTLTQDQTFDVATWNTEFFGADAGTIACSNGTLSYADNGPANEALQAQNAKTVLQKLNADVVVVEEVSDQAKLSELVSTSIGGYSLVCSDKFSYFFQDECTQVPDNGLVFGPTSLAQKVCVIYKTSTVTPILAESKPLLLDRYSYSRDGNDSNDANNWSSGRLPYLFVANVTINGVTRKMHLVGIHAKSGSATGDYNRRQQDILDLKAELDAKYPNANLVIAGDFNDQILSSIATGKPSTYQPFDQDAARYDILTKPLEAQGCKTFQSGSFLDHIIISNELQLAYIPNTTAVFLPGILNYNQTTSDHNPVVARFDLTKLPSSTSLTLVAPQYDCQTGGLVFRTTGGDGSPIEYMAAGVKAWSTDPNGIVEAGVRLDPNSQPLTLMARQNGNVVSLSFDFRAYCNAPQSFQLVEPQYDCQTGGITFRTTGGDGSPIEYWAAGVKDWSTDPNGIVEAGVRLDPNSQPLTLMARQNGVVITRTFDFRTYCQRPNIRQSIDAEATKTLQVRLLGNPVNDQLEVTIQGAENQTLTLHLVDRLGRIIETRRIDGAAPTERQRFDLHRQPAGLLFLQATTARQRQVLKVVKK